MIHWKVERGRQVGGRGEEGLSNVEKEEGDEGVSWKETGNEQQRKRGVPWGDLLSDVEEGGCGYCSASC